MRPNILAQIRAQPRLVTSILFGALLCFVLPIQGSTRFLTAWDCSTGLYLVLAFAMMARSKVDQIRLRADRQDEGQIVILGLVTITALVSLVGVMAELSIAKKSQGHHSLLHIGIAGLTVLLSWTLLHTMFAVHYAHEFYGNDAKGLDFPGHEPPDYWDFMYYSFVIGTACATADIDTTGKRLRKLTGLHSVVAFFFNTTILALMVNISASFI